MEVIAKLKKLKDLDIAFELLENINVERLKTMYDTLTDVEALITFRDKRKLSDRQRRLYRALLNDIYNWSGETTDFLHEWFKEVFFAETGERLSTADASKNSKSDMNDLLNIVIEFMFEWNVPFKKGYELLPKSESWYLYQCCKHRKCAVCGQHTDIHHLDAVGSGNNRNKVDHSKKLVIAICRKHHQQAHNLGNQQFLNKHHLSGIYLDFDTLKKLGLMTQKIINEIKENEQ